MVISASGRAEILTGLCEIGCRIDARHDSNGLSRPVREGASLVVGESAGEQLEC
jgi:hypothetical protein